MCGNRKRWHEKGVILKAFHEKTNPRGIFEYRRALLSEGFTANATLYINNLQYVSIGRVIPYKSLDMINDEAYNDIRKHIDKFLFSDMFKKTQDKILAIENENYKLKETLSVIYEKFKTIFSYFENTVKNLKKGIDTWLCVCYHFHVGIRASVYCRNRWALEPEFIRQYRAEVV